MMEVEPLIESPVMQDCRLIITGVGAVGTAYHVTKAILEDRPELIIQAGIAGSFDPGAIPGSVAIVKQDRFADLGVQEAHQWMDVFDLRLADKNDQPFKDGWLKNDYKELGGFGLPLVKAVTINEITTDQNRIRMLREKYQPFLESMEGAALHFVCIQEGVRFIQLRSISNTVGERDKSKWEMKLAIKNLNQALLNLIELMVSTPSST